MRPIGRETERYGLSSYDNVACVYLYTFGATILYALFSADKKNVEKSPNLNENLGKLTNYNPRN